MIFATVCSNNRDKRYDKYLSAGVKYCVSNISGTWPLGSVQLLDPVNGEVVPVWVLAQALNYTDGIGLTISARELLTQPSFDYLRR